jgi:hypothetical protein
VDDEAMSPTAPAEPASDDARLAHYASELADGIDETLAGWVVRSVQRRWPGPLPAEVGHRAAEAGRATVADVGGRVRELLETDIDQQWTSPLALLRTAVRYPTEVLAAADVPRPPRDPEAQRLHPDDAYDLTPAAFADIDPALHDRGIAWGAAKAHVHLSRRRREGRR